MEDNGDSLFYKTFISMYDSLNSLNQHKYQHSYYEHCSRAHIVVHWYVQAGFFFHNHHYSDISIKQHDSHGNIGYFQYLGKREKLKW